MKRGSFRFSDNQIVSNCLNSMNDIGKGLDLILLSIRLSPYPRGKTTKRKSYKKENIDGL